MEKGIVINNDDRYFEIFFSGSDLYFGMTSYNTKNELDNQFVIDSKNILYRYLKKLFKEYKKYNDIFNNNQFVWYSEAYGIMSNQNQLIITKDNDKYIIKFIQNKNNIFNLYNTCFICFCLSGSSNQQIANYFSIMLNELIRDNKRIKRKELTFNMGNFMV